MSDLVAALPMYDWPERRAEVDAQWAKIRDRLRAAGIPAPDCLARCHADLPACPGGIRNPAGSVIAPDPATLDPDGLDLAILWRHPGLVFAQACWGPLEVGGLAPHVFVLGQPSYDGIPGGKGDHYSSAIVMRRGAPHHTTRRHTTPSVGGHAKIPLDVLRGTRFAFNTPDSMSGRLALARDLARMAVIDSPENLGAFFSELVETGAHRASIRAVAEGRADAAAIDCRTWAMAQDLEPAAQALQVVGWTARRQGLPFIAAKALAPRVAMVLRDFSGLS